MKRTNRSGEPKAKRAQRAKPTAKQYEQLQKNSGEKKGVDQALTQADIVATTNTNDNALCLNLVRPGSGSYNRVGRKIFNKSIRLTGDAYCTLGPDATTGIIAGSALRMVVVWDKQPSGALPTFDDIFGVTAQDGTESSVVCAPPRYDNMGRFQILRDKTLIADPPGPAYTSGTTDVYQCVIHFDEYVKLGNRTTVFSGQSSPCTIADISSGGLYVYFRSDFYTNGTREWTIYANSNARLRYSD